jgi:hypothetical protein
MRRGTMANDDDPEEQKLKDFDNFYCRGWYDDDYDNYGFDNLGNTTDRNFGS